MKHTVGFVNNTVSRRYVSDTPEVFVPIFREAPQGNIKQGSGKMHKENLALTSAYDRTTKYCIDIYEQMIADGVAPNKPVLYYRRA